VFHFRQTDAFVKWLTGLRDTRAKARILARLESARLGSLGDIKAVGGGVSEMRIDVGAGYRVYFARRRATIIILLCDGDKPSQSRDIVRAKSIARDLDQE
jgi:putative addiction module killer protein